MQYIYVAYFPILFHNIVCIFSHISPPIVASSFCGLDPYISSNLSTSEPSQTRRRTSTVRPHRPCDFQVLPRRGRDTRADRAPRPNPLATRRTGAPRTPATSVGFRLIDELRAHRWGPPGPVPARRDGMRSRVRPARCTRTSSERIRASRPSARCRRHPARAPHPPVDRSPLIG